MTMQTMPILFLGHGSPMNALENNPCTQVWQNLATTLPKARAILVISAHWYTNSPTAITAQAQNQTIHDFYGFPPQLANYDYPSLGSIEIAEEIANTLKPEAHIEVVKNKWGLDHGVWSILTHIYPHPDMPILQLSIDARQNAEYHYNLGKQLAQLRQDSILIIASGNIVHNLGIMNWHKPNVGYDWAIEFDKKIIASIQNNDIAELTNYLALTPMAKSAVPTPDHYLPLLYIVGASDPQDKLTIFNQEYQYGSLSMTSFMFNQA